MIGISRVTKHFRHQEEKVTFAKVLPRNSTEEMGLEGCYELLQMCKVEKGYSWQKEWW